MISSSFHCPFITRAVVLEKNERKNTYCLQWPLKINAVPCTCLLNYIAKNRRFDRLVHVRCREITEVTKYHFSVTRVVRFQTLSDARVWGPIT